METVTKGCFTHFDVLDTSRLQLDDLSRVCFIMHVTRETETFSSFIAICLLP